MREALRKMLILHEGLELKPYRCTAGKLTIGIGRNLDDVGITKEEALYLLNGDINRAVEEVERYLPWVKTLDNVRMLVLVDMAFNMGILGLLKFKKMLAAVELGDYAKAADEMVSSKWYVQVGNRGRRLVLMMRTGVLAKELRG